MAKQKILAKPYEVLDDERDKKSVTNISEAQEVILQYMQGLEPPKPVKWIKPIIESFKPVEEQKDTSVARFGLFLNPMLRIHVNNALAKKQVNILTL